MIKITKRLRQFAQKSWGAKPDATDKEIRTLFGQKLLAGQIRADQILDIEAGKAVTTGTKCAKPASKPAAKKTVAKTAPQDADFESAVDAILERRGITVPKAGDVSPSTVFTKATSIRVKEAAEQYSTSRKQACYPTQKGWGGGKGAHPWAGQPARLGEQTLDHPSDLDKAISTAFMKFQATRSAQSSGIPVPPWLKMNQHDKELVYYAARNEKWSGVMNDAATDSELIITRSKLNEFQIKTLLDDTVSGGIEITPVVFDNALILIPVLYGELFPFVNVTTVARGRRVKGGAIINPTFTSGVGEGTSITPFNTSSFVTAFDTPIFPAVSAIEIGMDFEEDSPVNMGDQIVERFGLKALEYLDRVIAVGNGTSEPLGIFNTTAANTINSTNGAGGPFVVSDFEGLLFGLNKEFRIEAGAMLAYVSNDYTYRKARALRVGPGDERRVFGMDHQAYTLLDTPYKIQNAIPDGYAAYVNLRRYQMYRRLGMQVRVEQGGRQLALNNSRLLVVRMRYGGQLNQGGAACIMRDGQYV